MKRECKSMFRCPKGELRKELEEIEAYEENELRKREDNFLKEIEIWEELKKIALSYDLKIIGRRLVK